MRTIVLLMTVLLLAGLAPAQEILRGVILSREVDGTEMPVAGAAVY